MDRKRKRICISCKCEVRWIGGLLVGLIAGLEISTEKSEQMAVCCVRECKLGIVRVCGWDNGEMGEIGCG